MNMSFQLTKQLASHFGGKRNEVVIYWPGKLSNLGSERQQFAHIINLGHHHP